MSATDITQSNAQIEAHATALLRQQHFQTWNDADQADLEAWIAKSPRHGAAYWRLKAAWDQTERLAALRSSRIARTSFARVPALPKFANVISAAVVAAVVGAAAFLWAGPAGQFYATGVGGRTSIRLADGSELDLGTETAIRTHFETDRRAVEVIKGEVFFRVTHNAARPFVVTASGHRVIDIGTEFLVRTSPKALEVALIRGQAKVESAGFWSETRSAILHPGEVALATPSSLNVIRKSERDLADEIAWRRDALVFHNTKLGDAIAEFNRYNTVKLVIPDARVASLTINGTFRTNGIEQFARVTRDVFGLRVERKTNDIVLRN
jgi:transmembrane sensor